MSYTDNVAAFVDTVDSDLPAIPKDDLELVAGDILRKFKSNSSSASSDYFNYFFKLTCFIIEDL